MWVDALKDGEEIILATSSKDGTPRAIVVEPLGLVDSKLLIGVCQMRTSMANIKENNKVSIVLKCKEGYFRINGVAAIHTSGNYFEAAKERGGEGYPTNAAITIDITEVFDLDKAERVL